MKKNTNILKEISARPKIDYRFSIKISDYCPYRCEYCYIPVNKRKDKTMINKDKINDIIEIYKKIINDVTDNYKKFKRFEISVLGGEPLLYPHIEYLLMSIENLFIGRKENISGISILSNGLQVNMLLNLINKTKHCLFHVTIHIDLITEKFISDIINNINKFDAEKIEFNFLIYDSIKKHTNYKLFEKLIKFLSSKFNITFSAVDSLEKNFRYIKKIKDEFNIKDIEEDVKYILEFEKNDVMFKSRHSFSRFFEKSNINVLCHSKSITIDETNNIFVECDKEKTYNLNKLSNDINYYEQFISILKKPVFCNTKYCNFQCYAEFIKKPITKVDYKSMENKIIKCNGEVQNENI